MLKIVWKCQLAGWIKHVLCGLCENKYGKLVNHLTKGSTTSFVGDIIKPNQNWKLFLYQFIRDIYSFYKLIIV